MSLINIGVAPTASMRISRSAIETNPSLVQVTAVFAAFVMTLLATGCTQWSTDFGQDMTCVGPNVGDTSFDCSQGNLQ